MRVFTTVSEIEKEMVKSVPLQKDYKGVYTLDKMLKLADFLGNPQDKLRVIHVAGTSGKTSTSYYIARLIAASGKSVGLTVSPHITDIRERAQVNMQPLDADEYCKLFTEFYELIVKSELNPTYFETMVAFSFWLFAKRGIEYAVVEVGLGGTLDGTNIITRQDKVSVITDIGYDHVQVLGYTLKEIAANKAGIIKPGNAVFTHTQANEVLNVIRGACTAMPDSKLSIINPEADVPFASVADTLPAYQRRNWHLAAAVYDYIARRDGLPHVRENEALSAATATVPGRMETFSVQGKTIILDGAHNPQKLAALFGSLQEKYPRQPVAALFAMIKAGKEKFDGNLGIIMKDCAEVIVTGFRVTQDLHKHGSSPERIAAALEGHVPVSVVRNPKKALGALLQRPEPVLLITGSFYLITLLRPELIRLAGQEQGK